MIEGDPVAMTRANSAVLVELLRMMDRETMLVVIDRAAEALQKTATADPAVVREAIEILRTQFAKIS